MNAITYSSPDGGDLERRVSVVEQSCVSTAEGIRGIKEILVGQETQIRGIKEILVNQDIEIRGIKQILVNQDARIRGIEETLIRHDKKFDEIDKKFGEIDQRFDEIDQRFDEMTRSFGVLHGELQLVSSRQERHGGEITRILRRLELDSTPVSIADPRR